MNFIKGVLVKIIFLILFIGCDIQDATLPPVPDQLFEQAGMEGAVVNNLSAEGDFLYASTDDGVWRTELTEEAVEWNSIGLEGLNVAGVTELSDGSLLAGVQRENTQSDDPAIYKLDPFEEEWVAYEQNFGGADGYNFIYTFEGHPEQPDHVFVRGSYSAVSSTDGGESWQLIFGEWGSMGYQSDLIAVDPRDTGRIWIGGESAAFQPYLYYSEDQGQSWNQPGVEAGGDNAVYSMAFHPDDENRILIGLEGEIRSSDDLGETWSNSFENDLYHYILTMASPNNETSETVYASGTEYGAQTGNLFFLVTNNFGETWEKVSAEPELQEIAVNDIYVHETATRSTVYLATTRGIWVYAEQTS
jgi:hypothetical protein